jgi:hypothetical protein
MLINVEELTQGVDHLLVMTLDCSNPIHRIAVSREPVVGEALSVGEGCQGIDERVTMLIDVLDA